MKLAPSAKFAIEKSTRRRLSRVWVVASHNRSALPAVIASKRSADVTGT